MSEKGEFGTSTAAAGDPDGGRGRVSHKWHRLYRLAVAASDPNSSRGSGSRARPLLSADTWAIIAARAGAALRHITRDNPPNRAVQQPHRAGAGGVDDARAWLDGYLNDLMQMSIQDQTRW